MAENLLNVNVSELCLGKPALRWISATATVAEALAALRTLGETCLSVWSCNCFSVSDSGHCRCVGKVSVADVVCYLAGEDNLKSPTIALLKPLADLIPKSSGLVSHLEPNASLLEAMDVILEGAMNVVIPIETRGFKSHQRKPHPGQSRRHNKGREYCWITQEDIIRYLLNCIGLFSSTAAAPIASLRLIQTPATILRNSPAAAALKFIISKPAVAVVDSNGRLVGEISNTSLDSVPSIMACACAFAVLSAGELMSYLSFASGGGGLSESLRERLEERGFTAVLDWIDEEEEKESLVLSSSSSVSSLSSSCSSSDEEFCFGGNGGRKRRSVRRCEAVVCKPGTSLAAAMIQALAHRSGYVWVVEEDGTLNGIVTFAGMLRIFRERLNTII